MKRLFLIVGVLISQLSFCGDIDDGMSPGTEIRTGNDLTKDLNVKFIIRKAKSKVSSSGINNAGGIGGSGVNNGTNVGGVDMIGGKTGDIYIIQDIKGDVITVD